MGFLMRLFRSHREPKVQINSPDDSHLNRKIKEAKWRNSRAVHNFVEAAQEMENDANNARQVISDILARAETQKALPNADNRGQK